jgi:hypothetical protein
MPPYLETLSTGLKADSREEASSKTAPYRKLPRQGDTSKGELLAGYGVVLPREAV